MRVSKFFLLSFFFLLLFIFLLTSYIKISTSGVIGELPKDGKIAPNLRISSKLNQTGIYFGDLHVHTTFSQDAFMFSLPMLQGEGAHPPSDACNFARYCSSLDFFSITDHAEAISKDMWDKTINSIRSCEIVNHEGKTDLIAFPGWEWTQMGQRPEIHFGHKNIILRDIDNVPAKPIGAGNTGMDDLINNPITPLLPLVIDFPPEEIDFNFLSYANYIYGTPFCSEENTEDCRESALTPKELFYKLDNLNMDNLVIPHGTAWGIHSPPNSDFKLQLKNGNHDPDKQRLIEVYSGHGNSELFKDVKHIDYDESGNAFCPDPTEEFEPCCWRAGEIAKEKCTSEDPNLCSKESEAAKKAFLDNISNSLTKFSVVKGAKPEDWKQCGQLKNTFLPAYTYRPKMSAQYALASREESNKDMSFKFGLIASTDNHKARAGAGYKEFAKNAMGDAWGANHKLTWLIAPERGASFYSTGGLVAVHAEELERNKIFDSLYNRQAYATSGERILLWFDLMNSDSGQVPMGSEASISENPTFRVKAIGSLKQKEGCPDYVHTALSKEEISRLCLNECYNPSDERNKIEKIEVIKIIPSTEEAIVLDPWKTFQCEDKGEGCVVYFEDPEIMLEETAYYVRVLQEESLAVGGDPLRCERDEEGNCTKINICYASGEGFDPNDDCLAPINERAWSSPIFLSREKNL